MAMHARAIVGAALVVAFASWVWFCSDSESVEPGAANGASAVEGSRVATSIVDGSGHRRVVGESGDQEGKSTYVHDLLYGDEPSAAAQRLRELGMSSKLDRWGLFEEVLGELLRDVSSGDCGLKNVADPARYLIGFGEVEGARLDLVLRYKRAQVCKVHVELQAALSGWPCTDEVSCIASALAELGAIEGLNRLTEVTRDWWRRGGHHREAVMRYAVDASFDRSNAGAFRRLEAVVNGIAVADTVDGAAEGFAEIAMLQCEKFYKSLPVPVQATMAENGAAHPSVESLIGALASVLQGAGQGQGFEIDSERCLALVQAVSKQSTKRGKSQFVELVTVGLLRRLTEPWARDMVRRYAVSGPSLTLRMSALAQMGMTRSPHEIRKAMTDAVVASPGLLREPRFEIAYLAALGNSRTLFPGSEAEVREVYMRVLLEPGRDRESVRFVLTSLKRNPMTGFWGIVDNIARGYPTASIRKAAQEALSVLPN